MLYGIACLTLTAACAGSPNTSAAQVIAGRIASTGAARVQFEFAGKHGVCGDGENYLSTGGRSNYYGSVTVINGNTTEPCMSGPVRVVIDRAGDVVTNISTVAGPVHVATGAKDIGMVATRDAADYLMSIARNTDGRASRQAILPAAIADSVDVTPSLVALARDRNRPQDTRRSALSWLANDDVSTSPTQISSASNLLLGIAKDENEPQALRRSALSLLARAGHGAGIPSLVQLANGEATSWVAEQSLRTLSQSDDPRARDFLRKEITRSGLPDDQMAIVARGLGGNQATGDDITLLRNTFAKTPGERTRSAIMGIMANRGTAADSKWLFSIVRDRNQTVQTRRRALDLAARAANGGAEALALYDTIDDQTLKSALISLYARENDRAAIDKLISIAKSDENKSLRRRAISSLSRTQDPRARQALVEISTR
jgi:hypothetical protein